MQKVTMMRKGMRAALMSVALAGAFVPATGAWAALPAFPTTGSCAMIYTQPVPYGQTLPANNVGYNIMAVVTITSATGGTIEFSGTRATYATTGMTVASATSTGTVTFTIANATMPTGAKTISFSAGGGSVVLNAVAVNNGNTILIQGVSEAGSGVCQF